MYLTTSAIAQKGLMGHAQYGSKKIRRFGTQNHLSRPYCWWLATNFGYLWRSSHRICWSPELQFGCRHCMERGGQTAR